MVARGRCPPDHGDWVSSVAFAPDADHRSPRPHGGVAGPERARTTPWPGSAGPRPAAPKRCRRLLPQVRAGGAGGTRTRGLRIMSNLERVVGGLSLRLPPQLLPHAPHPSPRSTAFPAENHAARVTAHRPQLRYRPVVSPRRRAGRPSNIVGWAVTPDLGHRYAALDPDGRHVWGTKADLLGRPSHPRIARSSYGRGRVPRRPVPRRRRPRRRRRSAGTESPRHQGGHPVRPGRVVHDPSAAPSTISTDPSRPVSGAVQQPSGGAPLASSSILPRPEVSGRQLADQVVPHRRQCPPVVDVLPLGE